MQTRAQLLFGSLNLLFGDVTVAVAVVAFFNSLMDMKPWFTVYFFDIGHSCYDQLTPVKTRHLLTLTLTLTPTPNPKIALFQFLC